MKKCSLIITILLLVQADLLAQEAKADCGYVLPEGKEIYIPKELHDNDFTSEESNWSYHRMACTPNVVCFWEKGFGKDLSKAPDLDSHRMTVDLDNLLSRVEYFYNVYRDMMGFLLPGSNADRYRMMVMLKYSLEGTAYGGSYDDVIGALWIAPNRVQDKTLNCIAHELGHAFQIQISCDGKSKGMGGGIFETSAQWMLWQVNPRWTTDENYHWDAFKKDIHLRLFHPENMYHAPFVLEYWSYLHGLTYMADMFREGRKGEDFIQTYMRMYNVNAEQMGDELLDCYRRLVTFDFPSKRKESLRYACEMRSEMRDTLGSWKVPVNLPQTYGFNVDEIAVPKAGGTVKVQFRSLSKQENVGYRYGLVAVSADNTPTYLGSYSAQKQTLTYTNPGDTKRLYFVVVGCPTEAYRPEAFSAVRYPYMIKY